MNTFTLQHDTDWSVSEQLDDRSLLNLCIAVPTLTICNNDDFWRNRFLTRYGPINKAAEKTWKKVYLQLICYMDKGKNWNERMELAAEGGHRDLVDYFISKGGKDYRYDWTGGMYGAAQGGHRDLVDYFISLGGKDYFYDWNWGMRGAARGGHRDLVDYFIGLGAENWNEGLYGATEGGHRDLVDYFISLGGKDYRYDWGWGVVNAAQGGHRDLEEFFRQKMNQ